MHQVEYRTRRNEALIVLLVSVNPIDPIIETYLCKRVVTASRPQREQRRTVDDSDMIYIAVERPTPDACQLAGVSSVVCGSYTLHALPRHVCLESLASTYRPRWRCATCYTAYVTKAFRINRIHCTSIPFVLHTVIILAQRELIRLRFLGLRRCGTIGNQIGVEKGRN